MTPTLEELDLRVRALERRSARHDEDIEAIIETVVETRDEVKLLSQKFDVLQEDVGGLKEDVGGLKLDVGGLKEDVGGLKQDVGGLKQDVGGLKQDVGGLKQDSQWVKRALTTLLNHQGLSVEPDEPIST